MKKIFYLLGILVIGTQAQDLTTVSKLNDSSFDEEFYIMTVDLDDTEGAYMTKSKYVLPFRLGTTTIYPYSPNFNLSLGSSVATTYKLSVNGTSNFLNHSYFRQRLYLGSSNYITSSGSDIMLYDLNNPSGLSLTQLASGAATLTASNGITRTGDDFSLGGSLVSSKTITLGDGVSFYFTDASNDLYLRLINNSGNVMSASGDDMQFNFDEWNITVPLIEIGYSDYYSEDKLYIKDTRTNKKGLEYYTHFDNSAYPNAIPDVTTVFQMIADSSSQGTGLPPNYSGNLSVLLNDPDSSANGYDGYYNQDLEIDSSTSTYTKTILITNAQLLAGDSIMLIPSTGGYDYISVNKIISYMAVNTQYTGVNPSYIRTNGTSVDQLLAIVNASIITSATGGIRQTTDSYVQSDLQFLEYGSIYGNSVWWDGAVYGSGDSNSYLYLIIEYTIHTIDIT